MKNDAFSSGQRALITAPFQVEVGAQACPAIAETEVLVRHSWSVISPGTELAFYEGTHPRLKKPGDPWAKYPFAPGYASAGVVARVGSKIAGFAPGQPVFLWGGHATWAVADPEKTLLLPLPAGLDWSLAPFARFLQIVSTAYHLLAAKPRSALVLGAGLIGNLAAQVYRACGVPVIAVQDIAPQRLQLARDCGLPAIDGNGAGAAGEREALFGAAGPEVVIEATGIPSLIRTSCELAARRGQVVLLGSPRGEVSFDFYADVHYRGLRLVGAHQALLPMRDDPAGADRTHLTRQMLELMQRGAVRIEPLVSRRIRPDGIDRAYRELARRGPATGFLIDWNEP